MTALDERHDAPGAATAAAAVAAQLQMAIERSFEPALRLGRSLGQLADCIARLQRAHTTPADLRRDAVHDFQTDLAAMREAVTTGIESLQFHDRLVQHLVQLRELLTATAEVSCAPRETAAPPGTPGPLAADGGGEIEIF